MAAHRLLRGRTTPQHTRHSARHITHGAARAHSAQHTARSTEQHLLHTACNTLCSTCSSTAVCSAATSASFSATTRDSCPPSPRVTHRLASRTTRASHGRTCIAGTGSGVAAGPARAAGSSPASARAAGSRLAPARQTQYMQQAGSGPRTRLGAQHAATGPRDAGRDAGRMAQGRDAGRDAGPEALACSMADAPLSIRTDAPRPSPVRLAARRARRTARHGMQPRTGPPRAPVCGTPPTRDAGPPSPPSPRTHRGPIHGPHAPTRRMQPERNGLNTSSMHSTVPAAFSP
jgi:hypothetical protein